MDALVHLYADPDALRDASATSRSDDKAEALRSGEEITSLDAELAKTEAAVERYMLAFENGTRRRGHVRRTRAGAGRQGAQPS